MGIVITVDNIFSKRISIECPICRKKKIITNHSQQCSCGNVFNLMICCDTKTVHKKRRLVSEFIQSHKGMEFTAREMYQMITEQYSGKSGLKSPFQLAQYLKAMGLKNKTIMIGVSRKKLYRLS